MLQSIMLLPCHGQPALSAPVNHAVTRIGKTDLTGASKPLARTMATDKQRAE